MDVEVEEHVLYPSTMTVPELMGACGTASNNDYGLLGRALQRRWKQFQNGVPVWSGTSLAKGQAVLSPARLKARHDRQDRLLDDDAVGDAEEMQSPSGRQAEDRDLSHTADTCRNLSAFVSSSAIEIEVEAAAPDGKLQENSWLVLDGPLVGPQAAVLLPLLTGGQLSQSGDGGVFFIPRGMQVSRPLSCLPDDDRHRRVFEFGMGLSLAWSPHLSWGKERH